MLSIWKRLLLAGLSTSGGLLTGLLIKKLMLSNKKEELEEAPGKLKKENSIRSDKRKTILFLSKKEPKDKKPFSFNKLKIKDASSLKENTLLQELKFLDSPASEITAIPHLAWDTETNEFPNIVTNLLGNGRFRSVYGGEGFLPEESFIFLNSFVLSSSSYGPHRNIDRARRWLKAGPRKHLYFQADKVKAAIISCGGSHPGVNVAIREIVMSLYYNYRVKEIYGAKNGFLGLYNNDFIKFTPDSVKTIHHEGGNILKSAKVDFNINQIMSSIKKNNFNMIFVIGGKGSLNACNDIYTRIQAEKLNISICTIPRSPENDIPIIDKSIGFDSIIEEYQKSISGCYIACQSYQYGVGLIKVNGMNSGVVNLESCLSARNVDICLIPELPLELEGEKGLLSYIIKKVKEKKFCIVSFSEGVENSIIDSKKDENENIGDFLKRKIIQAFADIGILPDIKYIDPTELVGNAPANANDNNNASSLAQYAVHGSMAGFTGFGVGTVNNFSVYLPLEELTSDEYSTYVVPNNRAWQRVLAMTLQPSFINDSKKIMPERKSSLDILDKEAETKESCDKKKE